MRANIVIGVLVATASMGCVHRTIIAFADHPTQALTSMQIFETQNYLFGIKAEHKFLTCTDTGNQLVCKSQCGGSNDLVCPMAQTSSSWRSTNVQ